MNTNILAQVGGFPSISDMYQLQNRPTKQSFKNKPPEKAVEHIEAFYLKTIFLKNIFSLKKQSLLSDGENQFAGLPEGEFVNEVLIDQMAKQMAQQDILGFKKLFLKRAAPQETKVNKGAIYRGRTRP